VGRIRSAGETAKLKAEGRRFDPAPDHQTSRALACANIACKLLRSVAMSNRCSPYLTLGRRPLLHVECTRDHQLGKVGGVGYRPARSDVLADLLMLTAREWPLVAVRACGLWPACGLARSGQNAGPLTSVMR
jgi:hypothetical protein